MSAVLNHCRHCGCNIRKNNIKRKCARKKKVKCKLKIQFCIYEFKQNYYYEICFIFQKMKQIIEDFSKKCGVHRYTEYLFQKFEGVSQTGIENRIKFTNFVLKNFELSEKGDIGD